MPHELGFLNKTVTLKPVDKLVYVYLRSYANKEGETFVSLDTLSERCELSWKTTSDSIARLLQAQEIFLIANDSGRRCKTYKITKDDRRFEIFSQDFLDYIRTQNFTISEKCVLICLHEHSYKTKSYGEIHGSLLDLANSINMPERSFKRAMSSLKQKGIMLDHYNHSNQLVRRVEWKKIMMDTIYQVKKNTEDIEDLKQENRELRNEINQLKEAIYSNKYYF